MKIVKLLVITFICFGTACGDANAQGEPCTTECPPDTTCTGSECFCMPGYEWFDPNTKNTCIKSSTTVYVTVTKPETTPQATESPSPTTTTSAPMNSTTPSRGKEKEGTVLHFGFCDKPRNTCVGVLVAIVVGAVLVLAIIIALITYLARNGKPRQYIA